MQYVGGNAGVGQAIRTIVQTNGLRGLYSGYAVRIWISLWL
jgi:hypothetical protein